MAPLSSQKGGQEVEKTKRGKDTKIMVVAGGTGLPIAISIGSASPHEVTLVETRLEARFKEEQPERLIGDKADDRDPLDERLKDQGVQMIALHKSNRKKAKTQDGRPLRKRPAQSRRRRSADIRSLSERTRFELDWASVVFLAGVWRDGRCGHMGDWPKSRAIVIIGARVICLFQP
jgi:hypothetical protein